MFQISYQPYTRTVNYLTDGPLHSKRWIPNFVPREIDCSLPLPVDDQAYSKIINPNWRREWKEVLLFKTDLLESFRPIITVNGWHYTTLFSVRTQMFTMRVGPTAVEVVLNGTRSMKYSSIGFYNPNVGDQPLVLGQSEMTTFIKANGHKVTRI
jgi:hypothetical protein